MSFSITVDKKHEGSDDFVPEASYSADQESMLDTLGSIRESHGEGHTRYDRTTGKPSYSRIRVIHQPTGTELDQYHLGYLSQGISMDDVLHHASRATRGEWPEGTVERQQAAQAAKEARQQAASRTESFGSGASGEGYTASTSDDNR